MKENRRGTIRALNGLKGPGSFKPWIGTFWLSLSIRCMSMQTAGWKFSSVSVTHMNRFWAWSMAVERGA